MKAIFFSLASLILINSAAYGTDSKSRAEYLSAPLPVLSGRKLCVIVPPNWAISSRSEGAESPKSLCHFEMRHRSQKGMEKVHFSLIADPIFVGKGYAGNLGRGVPLTTEQGFLGVVMSVPEGKSIRTTFTFMDRKIYQYGLLYCEVTANHITEQESERLMADVVRNLRWEKQGQDL